MYDLLIHCRKFDKNLQKGDKEKVLQFRHCWVKQKFSSNAFEIAFTHNKSAMKNKSTRQSFHFSTPVYFQIKGNQ